MRGKLKKFRIFAVIAVLSAMSFGSDCAYARKHRCMCKIAHTVEITITGSAPRIDDKAVFIRDLKPIPHLFFNRDTLTLFFMGDVMLHSAQIENTRERYASVHGCPASDDHNGFDFSRYFSALKDRIEKADIAVANMEFTLGGPPFAGYPSFSAPDSYPEYAAKCGIDVFLLANNHIHDKGRTGTLRTLSVYEGMKKKFGVKTTGCFADEEAMHSDNPLFIEAKGMKVAFINFTYGTNTEIAEEYPKVAVTNKEQIRKDLAKAKDAGADLIVALPHWGIEYRLIHSAEQQEIAEWLADNGADIIVGSHPHVVQDIGICGGNDAGDGNGTADGDGADDGNGTADGAEAGIPVIYSLGNLISNMSAENTQVGLVVTLRAVTDKGSAIRLLEPEYTFTWCSLPGRFTDSHATIPIKEYIGRRHEWKDPSDYDRMTASYERVKKIVGIKD